MKVSEFIKTLETAVKVPNDYNNKYPKNCGFFDGQKYTFDCWNLIKSILGGWKPENAVGSFVNPKDFPTGDCTGLELLDKCENIGQDFSKCKTPGTYLYMRNHPHSGVYVGDRVIDGKTVNVIECTTAFSRGVLFSYMDEKGGRYEYKGGKKCYAWTDFGWLPYVEKEEKKPEPTTAKFPEQLPPGQWYRVRRSWENKASQIGAFTYKSNAIRCAQSKSGYYVFLDGVQVY